MEKLTIIPTIPPYAPYIDKVVGHPSVSGVRLNTVMPTSENLVDLLKRLKSIVGKKNIWIDLKCRQIRTSHGFFFDKPKGQGVYDVKGKTYILDHSNPRAHGTLRTPPWAEIKIDKKIKLDLSEPVKCYFSDGINTAHIVDIIDGDTLIMLEGPKRLVGGGESINIIHPSLEIEGYFTEKDYRYIEAAKKVGIHTYMLSFVEEDSDLDEMHDLDNDAVVLAKMETEKGMKWARDSFPEYVEKGVFLMAARGDLFVEMGRPDKILGPLRKIIEYDNDAVMASRILSSLRNNTYPSCADIMDIACVLEMGYHELMIGDDICFNKDAILYSLEIINAIGKEYGYE